MSLTIRGTVLQTPTPDELQIMEDHVLTVGGDGRIVSIEPAIAGASFDVELPSTSVLLPGLIDTHIHAPQWPQLTTGLDLPLDQWLFEYTFPLEARYADTTFAERVWDAMVPGLLAHGTTTAVYYGSVHEEATVALAQACQRHGQRAFVGRVAMDHQEGTPEWYRDIDAATGVAASHRSIEMIEALGGRRGLVRPIITPRFIPACSDALLEGLGELAEATGQLVQTHCSENDWEHNYVIDRHGCTDTESLLGFGLIRDHGVLAHAGHLTAPDIETLVGVGAGVAHCPLSNAYFGHAVFPARRNIAAGLRVGLGTDIAGGPEPSMLRQCAHAVTASRMLEDGVDASVSHLQRGVADSRITIRTAFWMATMGGADLLGIPAGLLEPGRVFDAIAVDTVPADLTPSPAEGGGVAIWPELDDWSRTFEKIVRGATPSDISHVWVDGEEVVPRS